MAVYDSFLNVSTPNVNGIAYLSAVENYLANGKKINQLSQDKRIALLQEIRAHVRQLWKSFNQNRSDLDKYYMDDSAYLRAYAACFLPANIERIYMILRLPEVLTSISTMLEKKYAAGDFNIHIIDYGAGPLTASVAFLLSLLDVSDVHKFKFTISAVERSEKAFLLGKDLLEKAKFFKGNIVFNRYISLDKIASQGDLVFAANVFNEIPEKHQVKTAILIREKMKSSGVMVCVEPGQDVHSKNLCTIRDALLAIKENQLSMISPCFHNTNCPLSAAAQKKDWCWFSVAWRLPELVSAIDKFCGLDHNYLNFSFLVMSQSINTQNSQVLGRAVSDQIPIKQDDSEKFKKFCTWAYKNAIGSTKGLQEFLEQPNLQKTLVCTTSGLIESVLCNSTEINRGQIVHADEIKWRCLEKQQTIPIPVIAAVHNFKDAEPHLPRTQTKAPIQKKVQLTAQGKTPKPRR